MDLPRTSRTSKTEMEINIDLTPQRENTLWKDEESYGRKPDMTAREPIEKAIMRRECEE